MFNVGIIASRRAAKPIGHVILLSSQSWVAPPGVSEVSIVLIGKGGDGIRTSGGQARAGGGGALTYKNSVIVIPGNSYSVNFSGAYVEMFGLRANNGQDGSFDTYSGDGGQASTQGSPTNSFGGAQGQLSQSGGAGGNAATYTGSSFNQQSLGTDLYGGAGGTRYGGGGSSLSFDGSPGGPSAVRIIWGEGRSFPNNAA